MRFHNVLRRCFSVVLASGKEGTMVGEIEMVSGCRMQVSGTIAAVLAALCEWWLVGNNDAKWNGSCRCFSHVGSGWCDVTLQSQTNYQQSQVKGMKQSWHSVTHVLVELADVALPQAALQDSWLVSRLCMSQATVPQSWVFLLQARRSYPTFQICSSQMFQHVSTIFNLCYPPIYKSWPFRRSQTVLSWHLRQSLHSNLATLHDFVHQLDVLHVACCQVQSSKVGTW